MQNIEKQEKFRNGLRQQLIEKQRLRKLDKVQLQQGIWNFGLGLC